MKQTIIFFIFVIIASLLPVMVLPVMAFTTPPMLERHIFMPMGAFDQNTMLPDDKIRKNLIFTGVIISEKHRYAFIKVKNRKKNANPEKRVYKEGDEILGSVIYKIFPNYIVLLNQGNKIKVKLYSGNKKRPASPVSVARNTNRNINNTNRKINNINKNRAGLKIKSKTGGVLASKNLRTKGKAAMTLDAQIRAHERARGKKLSKSSNPFAEALKKAMQKVIPSNAVNPFFEAIQRAKNKNRN